jgi:hypothetical protein
MKSKKNLEGVVGVSVAKNISRREGWEKGSDGTPAEKSRTHGNTLINESTKVSDHTPGLKDFEKNSGHDPRKRSGSPVVGSGKKFVR